MKDTKRIKNCINVQVKFNARVGGTVPVHVSTGKKLSKCTSSSQRSMKYHTNKDTAGTQIIYKLVDGNIQETTIVWKKFSLGCT